MPTFCEHCGSQVGEAWEFCKGCGGRLAPGGGADAGDQAQGNAETSPSGDKSPRRLRTGVLTAVGLILVGGGLVFGSQLLGSGSDPVQPRVAATATGSPSASSATAGADSEAGGDESEDGVSFADLYDQVESGVVRLDVLSCDDSAVGSGFLIDDQLVATAAHVVDGATTIGLTTGFGTTTGTVIGLDESTDLALVRTAQVLEGHVFEFADKPPRPGDRVAALGYPVANPLTMTQGSVSGTDRSLELVDGSRLSGLIQTDAALNQGNSGGPLLDTDGRVAGVVILKDPEAEGIAWALQADDARPHLDRWAQSPQPRPAASCDRPLGPSQTTQLEPPQTDKVSEQIAASLAHYFYGINSGDYWMAWSQLSPAAQERNPYDQFRASTATSYDFNFEVHDIRQTAPDTVVVYLTFTSLQAPGYGPDEEDCTHWFLDYTMRRFGGHWLIDRVTPHDNTAGHVPCGY